MDQLKFGIVGYGKMGKIREKSIFNSSDAILISVYDNTLTMSTKKIVE